MHQTWAPTIGVLQPFPLHHIEFALRLAHRTKCGPWALQPGGVPGRLSETKQTLLDLLGHRF